MALVLVRESNGRAVAAGHRGACARKLADEHQRYEGTSAVSTSDPSRAATCAWCYRPADYEE